MRKDKAHRWLRLWLLVVLVACGQRNATEATPLPPTPLPPTAVPPTSLGSDWEVQYIETGVEAGISRVYAHYATNYITYDELIVDDELVQIEYVCDDQRYDISDMFALESAPDEIPARYKSWSINFKPRCYIAFTVRNVNGASMGVKFKSHCPICNH